MNFLLRKAIADHKRRKRRVARGRQNRKVMTEPYDQMRLDDVIEK